MSDSQTRIMIVAAEASGDQLGADLARALRARSEEGVRLFGIGGARMADAGIASAYPISEFAIVGLFDGLWIYRRALKRVAQTAEIAVREQPHAVVLIDSWGFTIRIAERIRRLAPHIPIVKYVGPQVWAHRAGRAGKLAAAADLLLSTQVQDAPFYESTGLKVVQVGNPALNRDLSGADATRGRAILGAEPGDTAVLILPGSRPAEIARLMPVFGEAVEILARAHPKLVLGLPVAAPVRAQVRAAVTHWAKQPVLIEGDDSKFDTMKAASVALACSGTVTTELALAGCPMVIAYKLGPVSHAVLKRMYKQRYITLFNIAADRMIAPELVQDAATGPALAHEITRLLDDPAARGAQIDAQSAALDIMGRGGGDPSDHAAAAILDFVAERKRGAG